MTKPTRPTRLISSAWTDPGSITREEYLRSPPKPKPRQKSTDQGDKTTKEMT